MMSESFNMLKPEFEELLHGVPKLPADIRQDFSNGKCLDYSRILATVADDIDTYERVCDEKSALELIEEGLKKRNKSKK